MQVSSDDSSLRTILTIALPAVLQTLVRSSFSIIDAYWAGRLGSTELAAISVATFIVWGTLSFAEIISIGTNALVAQSTGAGLRDISRKITSQNIINTIIQSYLVSIVVYFALPFLYDIVHLEPGNRELANDFIITLLIGLPCLTLLSTSSAVIRGYGDTKTPFYMLLLAMVLNFVLAPLFIFGFDMSLKGIALSTLISYFAAFLISLIFLKKRDLTADFFPFKLDMKILRNTYRIGTPVSLNGIAFSAIYAFVASYVSVYGSVGFAALGIGHRSESIAFQICVGMSLAATVLVGQKIGAGNPKAAERAAWKIFFVSAVVMFFYGLLLYFFSHEVAMVFTSDPAVIEAASSYNKITSLILIFSAAEVVFGGAFSGAGDSVPPSLIGLPLNFLRIPLCAVLTPLYGLSGVWMAIAITVALKGIVIAIWFKRGNWKKRAAFTG